MAGLMAICRIGPRPLAIVGRVSLVGRQSSVRVIVTGYCVVAVSRRELAVAELVSLWV